MGVSVEAGGVSTEAERGFKREKGIESRKYHNSDPPPTMSTDTPQMTVQHEAMPLWLDILWKMCEV